MNAPDITLLLGQLKGGDPEASGRLFEAVYDELRAMASFKLGRERDGHTLQPTALVNEAFMRLVNNQDSIAHRGYFFGAAARAMERVLVDHARQRNALKRGGGAQRVTFNEVRSDADSERGNGVGAALDVLTVHEALDALERENEELAQLVRFRYFVGMTIEEIAEVTGVSESTVRRSWVFARAWLYEKLGTEPADDA